MDNLYATSEIKLSRYHKEIRFKNIKECLAEFSRTQPNEEAIIFVSTDGGRQSITWSTLYERSCVTASSFINLGVKRKEIVAINLRTCPEWLYASFGAMLAGAIPVAVSFTYSDGSDLVAMMQKLKCCSLLVMDPGLDNVNWNIVKKLVDEFGEDGVVKSTKLEYLRYLLGVAFDGSSTSLKDFHDLLDGTNHTKNLPEIQSEDVAALFQTSGSTGAPKLVAQTHASLIAVTGTDLVALDPNYILFNDRPFNWIGGFPFSVLSGQRRVTISGICEPPKDKIAFVKEIIQKERCSLIVALPPLVTALQRTQDELPSDWPVVGILTGGQPMTKALSASIGKAGKFLCCIYGATECLFSTQLVVEESDNFTEYACGKPLNIEGMEIKIVDENCKTVPVNTRGEIYIRTPCMFKEYLNDPEKTKAVLTTDGWYKTDDIGRMTEKGEFFVEGRKSNIIISGGMNVAPEILEQVLRTFPGVESAVIVPIPDEVCYQVICACVVLKTGSELDEGRLRKCCEDFHTDKPGLFTVLPKFYMILEHLPETNTGKVDRKEIERLAVSKFG